MEKRPVNIGALAALAIVAVSCSGTNDTEMKANIGIDLSRVTGLVITRGAVTGATGAALTGQDEPSGGGDTENQLYALNSDGSLTIVTVTDKGTSSNTAYPVALFDTRAYLLVAYQGVTHAGASCGMVAARKSDGALFCVTMTMPASSQIASLDKTMGEVVQSDATGGLVWVNHDDGVALLDLRDPTQLTWSNVITGGVGSGPYGLAVNGAGAALMANYNGTAGSQRWTRVYFPSGGFFDVDSTDDFCLLAGPAANPDDFYYTTDGPTTVGKLTATGPATFTRSTLRSGTDLFSCDVGRARAGAHLFMTSVSGSNEILDIASDVLTIRTVDAFAKILQLGDCGASLFVLGTDPSGNGGLVRYDVAAATFTTLLQPGSYALTTMAVSPGCDVTFYGQRASDGAFILGTVAAASTDVSVVATGFPAVTQIARIN